MKRKILLAIMLAGVGIAGMASAKPTIKMLEWNFYAPEITTDPATTFASPKKGDIVFESGSINEFLGYNGTNWVNFGGTSAANLNVTTLTSNTTLTTSNDLVLCDATTPGANFTVTLPTAVGNTGKVFQLKRTDNDLNYVVTIATTASQTIDGNSTVGLYTIGETFALVSDGANWRSTSHITNTDWISFTPAWTATTTSPTVGTNVTNQAQWRRVGATMQVQYTLETSAAGAAGSGVYLFGIPAGMNTSKITLPSTLPSTTGIGFGMTQVGRGYFAKTSSGNTVVAAYFLVFPYDSTHLFFDFETSGAQQKFGFTSSNANNFSNNPVYLTFTADFPVSGWQP